MNDLTVLDSEIWVRVVATLGVFLLMKSKALAAGLVVVGVVVSGIRGRRRKEMEGWEVEMRWM